MNTWTTLLTPTELEKSREPFIKHPFSKRKPVKVIMATGETEIFPSINAASINIKKPKTTIQRHCENGKPDRQGNHYRYI